MHRSTKHVSCLLGNILGCQGFSRIVAHRVELSAAARRTIDGPSRQDFRDWT